MADMDKINESELTDVSGGSHHKHHSDKRVVANLQSGYLAMRTQPTYSASNEIRGSELYNGDVVYIRGDKVPGSDGKKYVWVYSPKTGAYGYVNANFLSY